MYKFLILAAVAACAQAGYVAPYAAAYAAPAYAAPAYAAPAYASAAIGHSAQSSIRSADGSSSISQYSKAVDTAFSSVRKSDTRITNDARYLAAPAYAAYAAPAAYAAAPVAAYAAAPAYAAHATYAAPAYGAHAAYAAPAAYSAHAAYAAPVAARAGLLGVAYSAAPAVAHLSYDSPLIHYGF